MRFVSENRFLTAAAAADEVEEMKKYPEVGNEERIKQESIYDK